MKDRLDPLIAERAPWLFSGRARDRLAHRALMGLLGYDETLRLAGALRDLPPAAIMDRMAASIAREVEVSGLEHLPRNGPALIVANHPTGIADGIVLWRALSALRPDLFIYANGDILRVLPQMAEIVVPVEWRIEKRSHAKTRATMEATRQAIEAGRMGVIFPSGRLAKRRGLRLHERPWMASAAMIARKFDLEVIPLNIRARNSALFYLFDLIHPTLRDITLFHEVLNKARQPFRLTLGRPIPPARLPARSEDGIALLREATLALGGPEAPAVSLIEASRRPVALARRAPTRA
ncbi:MAG: lysophospholipid acyltransferase family protein [Paracoccaceae bacterium]|nr:lysophospholipid acyltransferase family protein [Paracoccaceae bacterium]MDE3238310.1 lysophospholipid acyltransferase family protein [Paracoccaceae bacterium]